MAMTVKVPAVVVQNKSTLRSRKRREMIKAQATENLEPNVPVATQPLIQNSLSGIDGNSERKEKKLRLAYDV